MSGMISENNRLLSQKTLLFESGVEFVGIINNKGRMIDFTKYLNCPACKEVELYCPTHRAEVEKILENENQ